MEKTILVKLKDAYLHELRFCCTIIRDNLAKVFETAKPPPDGGWLFHILPMEIHARIWSALTAAANVKKLLDDQRPRNPSHESEDAYEVRLGRASMLKDDLDGIALTEMQKGQMRNVLEHFDEYLDELNVQVRGYSTPSVATYNFGMSRKDSIDFAEGPLHHIRCYESSTRKFFYLEDSIDLGKIHDEAVAVLERLVERKLLREEPTTGVMFFLDFPQDRPLPAVRKERQ